MMRQLVVLGLLVWQASGQTADQPPVAQPQHMRYMRSVQVQGARGQACALLDAQIFPHAAPSLADLRLFPAAAGAHELPYAITMSEAVTEETQSARVLNLGMEGGRIAFDLEMPARAYTSVTLQLDPAVHDFIATAAVTGSDVPGGHGGRSLGTFTLFDLASQRLSRYTTLPLEESTFRYLHILLKIAPAPGRKGTAASVPNGLHLPGMPEYSSSTSAGGSKALGVQLRGELIDDFRPQIVQSAEVPPSREAQIVYTPVAETSTITTVARETRATFSVPVRVPVERVSFVLAPGFNGNFSRDVRITATTNPLPEGQPAEETRTSYPEQLTGNILRVHATEGGREIRTEQLSVPAILGANLQRGAKVEVAIENGDDQPLPLTAVRLEMRQRKLCFDASAAAAGALNLYYGDDRLQAPVYDYARLFSAARSPVPATLGPEQQNTNYQPPADTRSFTDRHPEVLWIALIVVICVLGAVAVRASKNVGR